MFFHGLFCYSQRNAKLNTVTKQKLKKNNISELEFCFKDKCVRSLSNSRKSFEGNKIYF